MSFIDGVFVKMTTGKKVKHKKCWLQNLLLVGEILGTNQCIPTTILQQRLKSTWRIARLQMTTGFQLFQVPPVSSNSLSAGSTLRTQTLSFEGTCQARCPQETKQCQLSVFKLKSKGKLKNQILTCFNLFHGLTTQP